MNVFLDSIPKKTWQVLTSALASLLIATTTLTACALPFSTTQSGDIHKIQHAVVIMQENRSFDSYFGTYPGADGIPMQSGVPTVCVNDPLTNQCVKPFHNPANLNYGGPHGQTDATNDINGGKMDGFIQQIRPKHNIKCTGPFDPACVVSNQRLPDVMGYHDAREIPNYWAYANHFVLQDHMFEPNASWSLPEHLFMVSEWSAKCTQQGDPMSCHNRLYSDLSMGSQGSRRRRKLCKAQQISIT